MLSFCDIFLAVDGAHINEQLLALDTENRCYEYIHCGNVNFGDCFDVFDAFYLFDVFDDCICCCV